MTDPIAFIKPDKRGHFLIGSIGAFILTIIWILIKKLAGIDLLFLWFALPHGFVSYVFKEYIHDHLLERGTPEWADGHYTFLPMLMMCLIIFLLEYEVF